MGLLELRKKREERWDELLNAAYSECDRKYTVPKSTEDEDRYLISELSEIRFADDSYLENYLHSTIESSLTFIEYYKSIQKVIPVEWFASHSETNEHFQEYNSLSILAGLNEPTRQMIWIDVPRTFNIFIKRSSHCSIILSDSSRRSYYLTVLCRILSVTSCLLGGWYCQGMSFVAASYIFYYDDISSALWNSSSTSSSSSSSSFLSTPSTSEENPQPIDFQQEHFILHELYSCCTYYHLILQSNNLSALYEWSVFLTMYLEEFEYQLSHTPETIEIYRHLQELKYPIEFFSMEWFTTCYVLSTSYDVSVHIQDMMIYGNQSGSRVDLLIRIGMAIIITLGPQILQFEDLESMQVEFRNLVLELTPKQIIPLAVRYRIIKRTSERTSDVDDRNTISDNILSRKLNPDYLFERPTQLSESSERLEWHRNRLVTTVDMKGHRNMLSVNTSIYSIESNPNSTPQLTNCAPQCLIS